MTCGLNISATIFTLSRGENGPFSSMDTFEAQNPRVLGEISLYKRTLNIYGFFWLAKLTKLLQRVCAESEKLSTIIIVTTRVPMLYTPFVYRN